MKKKTKHKLSVIAQVTGAFGVLFLIAFGSWHLISRIDLSEGLKVEPSEFEFFLKDDSGKNGKNSYVQKDNIDGVIYYYIKIGDQKSMLFDQEFQNKLKESLSGTSKNNMKSIEIPMHDPEAFSSIDVSIDVTAHVDENLDEFNKIITKIQPLQELTIRLYGGNEKMISTEKMSIKYSPPVIKMYQAEYARSNSYVVYVEEIENMGSSIESLKKQVEEFVREGSANAEINQKPYLIEHLKLVQRDGVNGKMIILTGGDYYRLQSSNFINEDFEAYRKKQNNRWYEIKIAKDKLASGEEVQVPSPFPSFFRNFNGELKKEFAVFEDACLVLTDKGSVIDKHDYFEEKIKLYDDLKLYCDQ